MRRLGHSCAAAICRDGEERVRGGEAWCDVLADRMLLLPVEAIERQPICVPARARTRLGRQGRNRRSKISSRGAARQVLGGDDEVDRAAEARRRRCRRCRVARLPDAGHLDGEGAGGRAAPGWRRGRWPGSRRATASTPASTSAIVSSKAAIHRADEAGDDRRARFGERRRGRPRARRRGRARAAVLQETQVAAGIDAGLDGRRHAAC